MRARTQSLVPRFVAGGAALLLILASITFCLCAPDMKSAGCQGCCTPPAQGLVSSARTCCTVVEGSLPASLSVQQDDVIASIDDVSLDFAFAPVQRPAVLAPPFERPALVSPSTVLRI